MRGPYWRVWVCLADLESPVQRDLDGAVAALAHLRRLETVHLLVERQALLRTRPLSSTSRPSSTRASQSVRQACRWPRRRTGDRHTDRQHDGMRSTRVAPGPRYRTSESMAGAELLLADRLSRLRLSCLKNWLNR